MPPLPSGPSTSPLGSVDVRSAKYAALSVSNALPVIIPPLTGVSWPVPFVTLQAGFSLLVLLIAFSMYGAFGLLPSKLAQAAVLQNCGPLWSVHFLEEIQVRAAPHPLLLLKPPPASLKAQGTTAIGRIGVPHPGVAGGFEIATALAAAPRLLRPISLRNEVGTVVEYWQRTAFTLLPSSEGVNVPAFQMPSTMFPLGLLAVFRSRLIVPDLKVLMEA